jgi:hypothetical protein
MKRRNFLQNTLAACLGATALEVSTNAAPAAAANGRDVYELRVYSLKAAKKPLLDEYLGKAFIPTLKRLGIGPVGVFSENVNPDKLAVYVLTVLQSADQAATLPARLAADPEYQQAGADYLAAKPADPVYERIETSLHLAIEPIFQRVGLTPVLFGQTIAGSNMPNLTYMLVFPDDAARTAAWKRFGGDDDWKKLKAVPEYADKEIVSRITNKVLVPESYSEI